jgi:hypothetical protein
MTERWIARREKRLISFVLSRFAIGNEWTDRDAKINKLLEDFNEIEGE